MRIIAWIFYAALFVLALAFALLNTEPVDLRLFAGQAPLRAPLVVFLMSFLGLGVALGLIAAVPSLFRQRREISQLRKELKIVGARAAHPEVTPLVDTQSAPVAGPERLPR